MDTSASSSPVVRVAGLTKAYHGRNVLSDITFEVPRGVFLGIVGPNGAGKTTTMEIMEGLRRPTRGSVEILGQSPHPRNRVLLKRIGVQAQSSAFFERLTVTEQLRLFAAQYDSAADPAELIERFDLEDHRSTRVEQLSGGLRQRLSLAIALVNRPAVLFLDEPTASLDPASRRELISFLASLRADGLTLIYTSHDLDEVEVLCDHVLVLRQGREVAYGATTVVARAQERRRISIPRAAVGGTDLSRLDDVKDVHVVGDRLEILTDDPNSVFGSLAALGLAGKVSYIDGQLEERFLSLMEEDE